MSENYEIIRVDSYKEACAEAKARGINPMTITFVNIPERLKSLDGNSFRGLLFVTNNIPDQDLIIRRFKVSGGKQ